MEAVKAHKLIHIAEIHVQGGKTKYLFLRQKDPHSFVWYEQPTSGRVEVETSVAAPNIDEALRAARKNWKQDYFRTIICGFRYTLPERDEHGINALFYQMVASYSSANGVYFDEELGHNCFVNFASQEARTIWQQLKNEERL